MLARKVHLERASRWLARQEQELQVRLARDLVASCRSLDRVIAELDRELERRTAELAPRCSICSGSSSTPPCATRARAWPDWPNS